MKKLLCLCDSPTRETGFGRVAQNLLPRWAGHFDAVEVWGIGFEGWPHPWPFRIFPAARYSKPLWHDVDNLVRFAQLLEHGGYTHLWMMQDTFHLAPMAAHLRDICTRRNIRSAFYFPVDAPLDPEWVEILHAVDVPVAYCEYGRREALEAATDRRGALNAKLRVIPHGVDTTKYFPLPKKEARGRLFRDEKGAPVFTEEDYLIVNVNMNQRRKGLIQTLQIVRRLAEMKPGVKLYMHMRRVNVAEGCDLGAAARQLGIQRQVFFAPDGIWPKGFDEPQLNLLYNAADLVLTTSLGEGWGLPIIEAMAAGTPVAGPRHTSVAEIMGDGLANRRGLIYKTEHLDWTTHDNSRLRPRANVEDAAVRIWQADREQMREQARHALEWVKTLDWDSIAKRWLEEVLLP